MNEEKGKSKWALQECIHLALGLRVFNVYTCYHVQKGNPEVVMILF